MRRLVLAILLLSLSSCWNKPVPPPVVIQDEADTKIEYPEPQGTHYEIPTQIIDKLPPTAGKESDDVIAVVSVPATTQATFIKIYNKHKTVRQSLFPTKGEPRRPVSVVSNNPGVLVAAPKVTPWWVIALSLAGVILAAWQALDSVFKLVSGPIGLIRKIFKI